MDVGTTIMGFDQNLTCQTAIRGTFFLRLSDQISLYIVSTPSLLTRFHMFPMISTVRLKRLVSLNTTSKKWSDSDVRHLVVRLVPPGCPGDF